VFPQAGSVGLLQPVLCVLIYLLELLLASQLAPLINVLVLLLTGFLYGSGVVTLWVYPAARPTYSLDTYSPK